MIKNIYKPDNEDILFWLAHNEKWPDSDWDLYVVNEKNDDLVFQLANDKACPEQEFFLHCLYYFVGEVYISNDMEKYRERIDNLFSKKALLPSVVQWKEKAALLLAGKITFDSEFWLNYLFFQDIQRRNIEDLLYEPNSVEKLREYALQLYTKGFSKEEIYQIFLKSDIELQNDKTEESYIDTLEDVMDMMVGWYPSRNIDFENEVKRI